MWSHYADNHGGVCYCFQKAKDVTLIAEKNIESGNVIYSSQVPKVSIFQEKTSLAMVKVSLKDVILTKSSEWSYEQEIRFFGKCHNSIVPFSPAALKAVIVGRRVSDEKVKEINAEVRKFNELNATDVRVLYSHRLSTTFQFGVDSSKAYRDNCENNFSARIPVLPELNGEAITTISKSED